MEKLIEILKEFDIDNIGALIGVSIILISVATGYIQLLKLPTPIRCVVH